MRNLFCVTDALRHPASILSLTFQVCLKKFQNPQVAGANRHVSVKPMLLAGLQVEFIGLVGTNEGIEEIDGVLQVYVVIRRSVDDQEFGLRFAAASSGEELL